MPSLPGLRRALIAALLLATLSAAPVVPVPVFGGDSIRVYPRLSVEVVGSGPDVLLIPGWGSSREVWRQTAEHLKHRHRVHLIQIAGFAGEPSRDNASGPVLLPSAAAVDDYIREAGLVRPAVVGHSLGGTIALWLGEMHPEDVGRILLVDAIPAQALMSGQSAAAALASAAAMRDQIRQTDYKDLWIHARLRARMQWLTTSDRGEEILGWLVAGDRLVNAQAYYDLGILDLRPGLGGIRVPVTMLFPIDPSVPAGILPDEKLYRAAYASVPGIRLVRIDKSRHYIMYDQPAQFLRQLDSFLARPPRS